MARILPVRENEITSDLRAAYDHHVEEHKGRITNMKATLGHSVQAFTIYMEWYPLYEETKKILGDRLAGLFAWSISTSSNCPLCSTYFRKIIIDSGENPGDLVLSEYEKNILEFGSRIALHQGKIPDHIYNAVAGKHSDKEMVSLIAFAGQMVATNIFSNVTETDIGEYLSGYLPIKNS